MGMHQSVGPDRGSNGSGPMGKGIRIATTEHAMWLRYFKKLWPTADSHHLREMESRIARTFFTGPMGPPMTKTERMTRMEQLKFSLGRIPPDPRNKLLGG
jgi:hypothetical protein